MEEQPVGEKATWRPSMELAEILRVYWDREPREHTRRLFCELKPNLMGVHDPVRIVFMVYFVHRKPISVLHSPIAKRKAYDLAKLHGVDRENYLGYHNRAELMKSA